MKKVLHESIKTWCLFVATYLHYHHGSNFLLLIRLHPCLIFQKLTNKVYLKYFQPENGYLVLA